jgi:hypothetical protein
MKMFGLGGKVAIVTGGRGESERPRIPRLRAKRSLHWVESPRGFRAMLPRADFWTEWYMKRLRDGITSTF